MLLKEKIAIITGGGQGIGKGIVKEFAIEGATVVVADINLENANRVCEEIKSVSMNSCAVKVDVTNSEDVYKLVDFVKTKYGRIDILVNNAGIDIPALVMEMDENIWDKTIEVNLKGVFLVTKAVGKIMIEQKSGNIINISSIAAKTGEIANSAYCVSKAGVLIFTDCLSKEWAQFNIRVNGMCPATIDTTMVDNSFRIRSHESRMTPEEFEKMMLDNIPLKRRGEPREVGRLAVFLASEESSYITGESVIISGGLETH